MPSKAYASFMKNSKDVEQLKTAHRLLSERDYGDKQGRRDLGALTKSALILLCGTWEAYVEDLLAESLQFVIDNASIPVELPETLRKRLCSHVRSEKHELKPLELCGNGWKTLCSEVIKAEIDSFNTPRLRNVENLYGHFFDDDVANLEITMQDIGGNKRYIPKKKYFQEIDKMVDERCEHAHARPQNYITLKLLKVYGKSLDQGIQHMEKNVCLAVERLIFKKPWR